ncbi:type 2 lanthipeptide synthetase LanM family protein [Paenibacillus agri]|uniref:Type 2 lantipeptide synthetase LanM n=1 Tax=Paenibacillus agri TaxID=2744309 RepID=A0A850EGX1_9BACL|nr:type 2 lanthipeptide synthetase LanM family protein [Paenibacillus agri]NUU59120.1 type 2 lantipeptide synthetase LanM [Paenibacillus agri]
MMPSLINNFVMAKLDIRDAASLFMKEREALLGLQFKSIDQGTQTGEIERWRKNTLLLDDSRFRSRLAADHWAEEKFGEIITAEIDPEQFPAILPKDCPHDWFGLPELAEALRLNRAIPLQGPVSLKLVSAFRPFLLWAAQKWDKQIHELSDIEQFVNTDSVREKLLSELADCLLQCGARTLVLELHVAKKLGELKGKTPEERFHSFVKQKIHDTDGLEFIYREYPMLARILMIRTCFIVEAVLEAVTRFKYDHAEIITALALPQDKSRLESFSAGMGDAHQQGRSVMRLRLESGAELMYKPKPLGVSLHFSKLLDWMNLKGFTPSFQPLLVLDKDTYGWEEYITAGSCETSAEVARFYQRLGGLLAVLYSTRGTDFHMENVIARGEHPVPIDLETLFHNNPALDFPDTADVEAKKKIVDSVIGTGLLPLLLYQNEEGFGVEMSGIGGAGEQQLPFPILQVENDDTDAMRFVRKASNSGSSNNRPMLDGKDTLASDFVDDIVFGFRQACSILRLNLTQLLDESDGPLASFRQDTIRIILRPTQFYANFLMETSHPNYTKDALEREKLLDRLWYTVLDERAISSEREDLLYGDIPYFTTTPASRDLFDSRGKRIIDFFPETSFDLAVQRLITLDEKEEERQTHWIISSILGSAEWNTSGQKCCNAGSSPCVVKSAGDDSPAHKNTIVEINTQEYIKHAAEIGDYLLEQAIYNKNRSDATWIGVGMNYRGQWNVSAMKGGLYDGTAGPALFLAYLGMVTGEQAYSDTARLALQTSLASLPFHANFSSAFYGQASILYTLSHFISLGAAEASWREIQRNLVDHLGTIVGNDHCYDLLGGAAGVIPVLLQVYKQFGNEQALAVAIDYGKHLLSHAIPASGGTAWPSLLATRKPLAGFGHGSAGIAMALQLLWEESGIAQFNKYAESTLAFERVLFSPEHSNWADLRKDDPAVYQSNYWCHGSAGIGLGRLLMYNTQGINKPILHAEILAATEATLNHGIGASHCLCHGDMGNSELLLQSSIILGRPEDASKAHLLASRMISEKKELGVYRTGIPRGLRTPGLFLGYSGIGYQLLRLADHERIPSVLSLEISTGVR